MSSTLNDCKQLHNKLVADIEDLESANFAELWYARAKTLEERGCKSLYSDLLQRAELFKKKQRIRDRAIAEEEDRFKETIKVHGRQKLAEMAFFEFCEATGTKLHSEEPHRRIIHKKLADELIAFFNFKTLRDTEDILYYQDGLYRYGGEAIIKSACEELLGDTIKTYDINEVIGHVKRSTYIDRGELNVDKWMLNLKNGLFNIKTEEFKPHTSEFLSTIRIPVIYDPDADCPTIKKFLADILYERDIPVVEEMTGYCLLTDYRYQYWFLLHGEGENGKSTLLALIVHFLGAGNIAAVALQNLNQRFATESLYGKLANIVPDLSSQDLRHTHNLKALTGGDRITAEPKFKKPFTFINHAKLIYSCNQIPASSDKSRAFYRRVKYIAFPHNFTGMKADKTILEKLITAEELSGLLNLAIAGLQRLLNTGDFTGDVSPEEMKEMYERASNPVYGFFQDCCEVSAGDHTPKSELYSAYCEYCEENGFVLYSEKRFVENMKSLTKMDDARFGSKGKRKMVWLGLKLRVNGVNGSDIPKDRENIEYLLKLRKTPDTPDTRDAQPFPSKCVICGEETGVSIMRYGSRKLAICSNCGLEDDFDKKLGLSE